MLNPMNKSKGLYLSILLPLGFLFVFYGKVIFQPNKYLFTGDGDGLMTYYSVYFHAKHDTSFSHYNGFNYPFGDLYNFTDGQPIVANSIKALDTIFPGIYTYSAGFINLFILFSIVLCSFFLYKILLHHGVTWWFSAIFAFLIAILWPQTYRIVAHPSLPYAFFLPGTWYFFIKHGERYRLKSSILIALFNLILFFIHPYLGIISMFLLFSLGLTSFLKDRKNIIRRGIHFSVQSFTGVIVFFSYLKIMGNGEERPVNFYELYTYNAKLSDVFLPNVGDVVQYTNTLFNVQEHTWESWSFIGFPALIVLILISIRILFKIQKKAIKSLFKTRYIRIWIIAFLTLIVAFGVPYKLGIYQLLPKFPFLAQIRALARFTWVFFLLINVYSVIYLFKIYKHYSISRKNIHAFLVLSVMIFLYGFSAIPIQKMVSEKAIEQHNLFAHPEQNTELNKLITKAKSFDYDAIIALPFYYKGDRFGHESTSLTFQFSKFLAIHAGKPLVNSSMTRTPNIYGSAISEIFGMHLKPSLLLENVQEKKAIILKEKVWIKPQEQQLLRKSTKLFETAHFELYSCRFEDLLQLENEAKLNNFLKKKDQFITIGNLYLNDSSDLIFYSNFENDSFSTNQSFSGSHCLEGKHLDYTMLLNNPNYLFETNIDYEINYWYHTKSMETYNIMGVIEEKRDGQSDWTLITDTKNSYDHIGDWTYVSFVFQQRIKNSHLKYFLKGHIFENPPLYVDQVMVKKKYSEIYSIEDSVLYYNNYPVGKLPNGLHL